MCSDVMSEHISENLLNIYITTYIQNYVLDVMYTYYGKTLSGSSV